MRYDKATVKEFILNYHKTINNNDAYNEDINIDDFFNVNDQAETQDIDNNNVEESIFYNEIETLIFKIQLVQLFFFKITNWGVGGEEGSTMILCTVKQVCEKETDEDRSRLPFNIMVMTLLLPIVFARNSNKEYIKR